MKCFKQGEIGCGSDCHARHSRSLKEKLHQSLASTNSKGISYCRDSKSREITELLCEHKKVTYVE